MNTGFLFNFVDFFLCFCSPLLDLLPLWTQSRMKVWLKILLMHLEFIVCLLVRFTAHGYLVQQIELVSQE